MAVDIIARALAAKALNEIENGGGVGGSFEAPGPTVYEVGGIPAGTDLDNMTWQQIFTMMLYGQGGAVPVFTEPKFNATLYTLYGTVGSTATITGNATFDRGTIVPAYGTSGFRAGAPTSYVVNGVSYTTSALSYDFSTQLEIVSGDNQFTVTVNYAEGEQPKDGTGADYDSPYPAGSMSVQLNVIGTYPVYYSNPDGELMPMNIQEQFENGELVVDLEGEETEENKQAIAFAQGTPTIVGIQQYDDSRQDWYWLFGSPEKSLNTFTVSTQNIEVNGNSVSYTVYTNNTVLVGARKLKFFTALPSDQGEGN